MKDKTPFRAPEELHKKRTISVGSRILFADVYTPLTEIADRQGISMSYLIASVLTDYVAAVASTKKRR